MGVDGEVYFQSGHGLTDLERAHGAQRGGISAHRSQHKTGGEVARMEVLVDGVLGNYYIAVGRGI